MSPLVPLLLVRLALNSQHAIAGGRGKTEEGCACGYCNLNGGLGKSAGVA